MLLGLLKLYWHQPLSKLCMENGKDDPVIKILNITTIDSNMNFSSKFILMTLVRWGSKYIIIRIES